MAWDDAAACGFALGAVLLEDRALAQVRAGVDPALLEPAAARLARLPADGPDKVSALRELVAAIRPGLACLDALPVRARALLAAHVPREQGRRHVREAPHARPDFDPPPALFALLERLARTPGSTP